MSDISNKRQRVTVRYKSPNPLFEKWLNEWKDEAKMKGSKLEYTYRNAIRSLKQCPIVFNSGQECKILKGFGDHLCRLLDQRLREYKSNNQDINLDEPELHKQNRNKKSKEQKVKQKDVPAGGLSDILESGSSQASSSSINSDKLISIFSEEPTTQNNVIELKDCLDERKEDFRDLHLNCDNNLMKDKSKKIKKKTTNNSLEREGSNSQNSQASSFDEDYYIFEPGNFDIILYIDTAETGPSDPLMKELNKLKPLYQFELKKLNVGDYVWICRHRDTKKELVLPYIFERKRLDDLADSIKDGRYKEQKYRLKRSGIDYKYYLIEQYQKHVGLPLTSLQQAAINTAVQDGFRIKVTSNLSHTVQYLNRFSSLLKQIYDNKTLVRCSKEDLCPVNVDDDLVSLMSFREFNQGGIKNKPLNVTDLFIKMLIQIKGMSVEKAMAITQKYPTPVLLKRAINECNVTEFQKSLSDLSYGRQKVGMPLSNTVVQLFSLKSF